MKKRCGRCRKLKPLKAFAKGRCAFGRQSYCRECSTKTTTAARRKNPQPHRDAVKRWRAKRIAEAKALLEKMKDRPCADCNTRYPTCVMDFDHDPLNKIECVSRMVYQGRSLESIKAEAAKCEVICSNCHRIRTWMHGRRKRRSA